MTFLRELAQPGLAQEDSSALPVENNEKVEACIGLFTGSQRGWMERALRRSGRHVDRMKQILREEDLPEDLIYLALIESGFNPYAYSRAGAAGIWQFMPHTGRRYGLAINWWVDERRDYEKSTRAAARYLKDLYSLFDDWYLAAAAYNAGEGKLQRAILKYDSTCFWDLSQYGYLRSETKNYVPSLLAALKIAKDPEGYEFTNLQYDPPLLYETVRVPDATDLAVIARGCGTSLSLLNLLNPQLQRGCTPPDYPDYEVKIPPGTKESFLAYYEQLDPKERLTFRRHQVRKNETLSKIAQRYGVSLNSLASMNRIRNPNSIRVGRSLIIPLPASHSPTEPILQTRATSGPARPADQASKKVVHVVKKGDTLWRISQRYGVSLSCLRTWNGLRNSSPIHPGQRIVVWRKEPVTKNLPIVAKAEPVQKCGNEIWYTVKRGDSLWDIARTFEVTVAQISEWNGLNSRHPIRPGLRLRICSKARLDAGLHPCPPEAHPDPSRPRAGTVPQPGA